MKNFILGSVCALAVTLCGAAAIQQPVEYEHIYVNPENYTMHLFTQWTETPIPKKEGVFIETVAKLQKNGWRVVAMDDVGFIMMREK